MKVTSFHFMPYRDLPDDFPKGLDSAWVDAPWWEYGDANKVSDFYNWSIDELMLAARLGFDGIGTNTIRTRTDSCAIQICSARSLRR